MNMEGKGVNKSLEDEACAFDHKTWSASFELALEKGQMFILLRNHLTILRLRWDTWLASTICCTVAEVPLSFLSHCLLHMRFSLILLNLFFAYKRPCFCVMLVCEWRCHLNWFAVFSALGLVFFFFLLLSENFAISRGIVLHSLQWMCYEDRFPCFMKWTNT